MTTPTWYSKALADNTFATAAQAVPTGGTTGQILAKSSGTNYATEWIDASAAQVQPDWDATSGMGQILNKPTLGTAAAQDVSAFATAAQGTLATNAVPNTRTVNGKALSANVTLAASDVGAVPTTRTVNGKALSADVTLAASDVSALPTTIGSTATSSVVVVANGAAAPSGLPDNTVIVEKSA